MSEFQAPKALIIYGEGLELPLEGYIELLAYLGERGIKATITAGELDSDLGSLPCDLGSLFGENETQRFYDSLTLTSGDDISRYAAEHGYGPNCFKWGWQIAQSRGDYFPKTAQGARSSGLGFYSIFQQAASSSTAPKFYYASDLLTPRLVALGHGQGIDLERGASFSELYYATFDIGTYGTKIPFDGEFKDFYNAVHNDSRVDVASLKSFIDSDDFRKTANIGPKTIRLFQDYCADTLPPQKDEATEWLEWLEAPDSQGQT
ncbi:MAG: hypothetical protein ACREGF_00845 [Candidatus Saccharimonadales bacterium]